MRFSAKAHLYAYGLLKHIISKRSYTLTKYALTLLLTSSTAFNILRLARAEILNHPGTLAVEDEPRLFFDRRTLTLTPHFWDVLTRRVPARIDWTSANFVGLISTVLPAIISKTLTRDSSYNNIILRIALMSTSASNGFLFTYRYELALATLHKSYKKYWDTRFERLTRNTITQHISSTNETTATEFLKQSFRTVAVPKVALSAGHTHPSAASERNGMRPYFQSIASRGGDNLFMLQLSKKDGRCSVEGNRQFYWSKDVNLTPNYSEPPTENAILGLVDVDYYLDMRKLLALNKNNGVLIYTIQPTAPAGKMHDTQFWFDNNQINTVVAGGSSFRHKIWNYGHDSITAAYMDAYGLQHMTTYIVERQNLSDHRQVVMLMPTGHWTGADAELANNPAILTAHPLEYFEPHCEGFNVVHSHTLTGTTVSVCAEGFKDCATITLQAHEAIRAAACSSKNKLNAATVESYLEDRSSSKFYAQLLLNYFNAQIHHTLIAFTAPAIDHYEFQPDKFRQGESKPSLFQFMTPIIGNLPAAPTKCLENDKRTVKARVTDIQHKKPLEASNFLRVVMREFSEYVVPADHAHTLIPTTIETVYEKQNRPTQVRNLDEANTWGPFVARDKVKCFQKGEAYGTINDPRNITTINPKDKMEYSRFCYSMADLLKVTCDWYTFGKSPQEISERVAYICRRIDTEALLTDFSRMDGRVSSLGRELTTMIFLRAFKTCYHDEYLDTNKTQSQCKARTAYRESFSTLFSRLSGSPETSLTNTIESAFIKFLAMRRTHNPMTGTFYTKEEAWDSMQEQSEFGGDDGLMGETSKEAYAKAASEMGHVATADVIPRGGSGVTFLARYYGPGVWTGDPNNMCDILRQLSKFHTTPVRIKNNENPTAAVTPTQKLTEKCISYYYTDRETPIIGEFCQSWLKHKGIDVPSRYDTDNDVRDLSWWAREFGKDDQFVNRRTDWMEDYVNKAIPTFDWDGWNSWLSKDKTDKDFLEVPCFSEAIHLKTTKASVVINGEVHHPDKDIKIHGPNKIPERKPNSTRISKAKSKATTKSSGKSKSSTFTKSNKPSPRDKTRPPIEAQTHLDLAVKLPVNFGFKVKVLDSPQNVNKQTKSKEHIKPGHRNQAARTLLRKSPRKGRLHPNR